MIRRILVGLDQSELSEIALQKAIALAKSCNAQLRLVHVLVDSEPGAPQQISYLSEYYYPLANETVFESYQSDWNQFVDHYKAWLLEQVETAVNEDVQASYELAYGRPGSKLCDIATSWSADLIIVGRRGRSGLGELLLGSVSNYVMHHAPCSVFVVHPKGGVEIGAKPLRHEAQASAGVNLEAQTTPKRILVPVDKSDISEEAIKEAVVLAKAYGAELRLLHVLVDNEPGSPKMVLFNSSQYMIQHNNFLINQYQQEWNKYVNDWWVWLESHTTDIHAEGVTVSCDVLQGLTGPRICEVAKDWRADLIVMGCRGLSGFRELLIGSTSYYVSHRAPCSVWITHPSPLIQDAPPMQENQHHSPLTPA